MTAEKWDTMDRESIEALCNAAKIHPDLANQPWLRLRESEQEKVNEVEAKETT